MGKHTVPLSSAPLIVRLYIMVAEYMQDEDLGKNSQWGWLQEVFGEYCKYLFQQTALTWPFVMKYKAILWKKLFSTPKKV